MSNPTFRWLILLAIFLFLGGCNTHAKWTYPINPDGLYRADSKQTEHVIAVLPFLEERPNKNRGATVFLYLIPFMPFGWSTYERPDAAKAFNTISEYEFQVDEDLAKAATRSLDNSGLFKRVYFTFGGEIADADYTFQGTARRTLYNGKTYSYGLSVYGPLLWYFGLPAGSSRNEIIFDFKLVDKAGREAWSFSATGDHTITQGIYYNWGNDALHFSTLMENAMNEALLDLERKLPEL